MPPHLTGSKSFGKIFVFPTSPISAPPSILKYVYTVTLYLFFFVISICWKGTGFEENRMEFVHGGWCIFMINIKGVFQLC